MVKFLHRENFKIEGLIRPPVHYCVKIYSLNCTGNHDSQTMNEKNQLCTANYMQTETFQYLGMVV